MLTTVALVAAAGVVATMVVARPWVRRRRAARIVHRLRGAASLVGVAATGGRPGPSPLRWRDERRYGAALPLALEEMARSLRSGTSLLLAVGEAAAGAPPQLAADLTMVTEEAMGAGLVSALETWRRRRPRADVGLAVAALALAAETGGGQARAVDGVAAGLRQRQAVQAELWAAGAQARLSALVIAVAPVGFGLLVSSSSGGPAHVLLGSTAGLALLAAALALDGIGVWWMVRLTRLGR